MEFIAPVQLLLLLFIFFRTRKFHTKTDKHNNSYCACYYCKYLTRNGTIDIVWFHIFYIGVGSSRGANYGIAVHSVAQIMFDDHEDKRWDVWAQSNYSGDYENSVDVLRIVYSKHYYNWIIWD